MYGENQTAILSVKLKNGGFAFDSNSRLKNCP